MGLYWLTGMTGQLKGKSERGWERGGGVGVGGALAQGHALGAIIVQTDVSSRRRHNRREKSGRLRESDKSEFLGNPIEVCNLGKSAPIPLQTNLTPRLSSLNHANPYRRRPRKKELPSLSSTCKRKMLSAEVLEQELHLKKDDYRGRGQIF